MNWVSRESAAFAWLILFVLVNVYWITYDLWAHYTGHKAMTTQFRDWLHEPIAGPVIAGLWAGIFIAFTFHFLVKAHK